MSGTTVQILGQDGKPMTAVRPDQAIEIRVTLPEGKDLPDSVEVTITTDKDTAVITVPKQPGSGEGNPTYSTGSVQLGHGVADGYGWGKGPTARIDIGNGASVHVSSDGAGANVTWYPDDLQQAIGQSELAINAMEAYLRGVQLALKSADETPEITEIRRIIDQKLELIKEIERVLANPDVWPRSKIYASNVALTWLRQPGLLDLREIYPQMSNAIRQGKEEGKDIVLSGFADLTLVFYEQFTSATGAAAMWTLVFGQDIYGKQVTGKDRLFAAAEVGLTAVTTILPILHLRSMTVGRTTARIPRGRPDLPRPLGGVDPKGAPMGVRAHADEFGMLPEGAAHVNTVASNNGAIIQVRPTNQSALKWRELGHPGKPMDIKAKTINELDVHLGARQEDVGLVGYFEPKRPVRQAGMSDRQWSEIETRFRDRTQEFADNRTKMEHLQHEGKIRVDEHGVVIDTGICGGTGKGITGDYDLWRITKVDGTPFSPIDEELIVNQLRFGAYGAQHGAHTSWKIDPKAPMYVADPDLLKGHLKVDADIKAKHQLGAGKAEAVIEFGGTNRPPVTAYEGGHAPGSVTAPTSATAAAPPIAGARRITGPTRIAVGAAVLVFIAGAGWVMVQPKQEIQVTAPAAVAAATASPASAPTATSRPAAAANRPPVIARLRAVLEPPQTTYTAETADPDGDQLTYEWSLSATCGIFDWKPTSNVSQWLHPHPPCPTEPHHPGVIKVTVRDGRGGEATLSYLSGSADGQVTGTR